MRSALAAIEPETGRLAAEYVAVRRMTEHLCSPLTAEDQMVQSMPDASPTKWHQAHTSWFFETFVLLPHAKGYRALDERYTHFFNSYYKQLGGHPVRSQRGLWSRPSVEEVRRYRSHVDEHMVRLLDGGVSDDVAALVVLGINHEQQHQELIVTDIKHALWSNPLRPAYRGRGTPHVRPPQNAQTRSGDPGANVGHQVTWIEYEGGEQWIGYAGDGFSFDNETPRHRVLLNSFRIASRLTANGEYMEFMRDGGYTRPELWLSDGWDAVCANGWRAPLYWEQRDGAWGVYTLDGERAVDPAEPACHVSCYEADAYARWAGARLATEFEWEVAAGRGTAPSPHKIEGNLLESDSLHPCAPSLREGCGTPVAAGRGTVPSPHETKAEPARQMFGDVWEWTASPYVAYPGYKPAAGVLGEYNGKFMCNQMVLRGGSCATPASHIRATYRNFFPPHARWQFSGIRLAHD